MNKAAKGYNYAPVYPMPHYLACNTRERSNTLHSGVASMLVCTGPWAWQRFSFNTESFILAKTVVCLWMVGFISVTCPSTWTLIEISSVLYTHHRSIQTYNMQFRIVLCPSSRYRNTYYDRHLSMSKPQVDTALHHISSISRIHFMTFAKVMDG